MAGKDITEKSLLGFNDVFADVVNAFFAISGINRRIDPDDLEDARTWSMYKAEDKLREQERDVVKLWKSEGAVISLIGLENQSDVDSDMALRIFGYEGADYRGQLSRKETKPYFVMTVVLYYGTDKRWNTPKSLFERLNVPEEFKPFVNDIHVNVIELAWLTDEQADMFKGDFRLVVDFLRHSRTGDDYVPTEAEIKHVDEILKLMHVMTGDRRFENVRNTAPVKKGERQMVKSFLEIVENKGIAKGRAEGRLEGRAEGIAEGIAEGRISALKEVMQRLIAGGMSPEEAAAITDISSCGEMEPVS